MSEELVCCGCCDEEEGMSGDEKNILLFVILSAFVLGVVFILNNPHGRG